MRLGSACPGIERIEAEFAGHAYDSHRHDTYALGLTLTGVQSFHYRGARIDSPAGHALILHPDEAHDGQSGAAGSFRYRMLYIAPSLIQEALGYRHALPFVRGALTTDRRFIRALRPALTALDKPAEPLAADATMLALAEALAALDPSAQARPTAPACARAVRQARDFLDTHRDEAVSSEALERITGLDRFTLARQFRRLLGTSPYRYLTLRRVQDVKTALHAGASLVDAAFSAGFADQSHMTRHFKQVYGLPPGQWRRLTQAPA